MDEPTERSSGEGDLIDVDSAFDGEFDAAELPATVDRAALRRMQLVSNFLDDSIRIPGTSYRIGADPIIGVIPGAGDAVTTVLSLYIVAEAARLGVSPATLLRMIANVSIDLAGGSVPYLGGLFDAAWKANKRNVELFGEDRRSANEVTIDVE